MHKTPRGKEPPYDHSQEYEKASIPNQEIFIVSGASGEARKRERGRLSSLVHQNSFLGTISEVQSIFRDQRSTSNFEERSEQEE